MENKYDGGGGGDGDDDDEDDGDDDVPLLLNCKTTCGLWL